MAHQCPLPFLPLPAHPPGTIWTCEHCGQLWAVDMTAHVWLGA